MVNQTSKCPSCKERCFLTKDHINEYQKLKKEYFNENNCFQKRTIHKCQFTDTDTHTHRFYNNQCIKEFNTECEMIIDNNKKVDTVRQNHVKIKERCICMNPKYNVNHKNSISCMCYPLKFDVKNEPTYISFTNNITCNKFLRKKCKHRNFYRNNKFFNNVKCKLVSNMTTFERIHFGDMLDLLNTNTDPTIDKTNQSKNNSFNILLFSTNVNRSPITNTMKGIKTNTTSRKNTIRSYEETGKEETEAEDNDEYDYTNYLEHEEEEEEEEEEEHTGDIVFYGHAFEDNIAQKLLINGINNPTKSIQDSSKIVSNSNYISLHETILEQVETFIDSITNNSSAAVFFGSVLIVGFLFLTVCLCITTANCRTKRQIKKRKQLESKLLF